MPVGIFLMSLNCLYLNIPVSILSYLHIDLRLELLYLKVVFNPGASILKVPLTIPTFPSVYGALIIAWPCLESSGHPISFFLA